MRLSHPWVRLYSFMAVTFPEEPGCSRSCGFVGMDLLVFEGVIVLPFTLGLQLVSADGG